MPEEQSPFSYSSYDEADDDVREDALVGISTSPSDVILPQDAMGDGEWAAAVSGDRTGGLNADDDFRFSWDWEMDPSQRAFAIADVSFRRQMESLVQGYSDYAGPQFVDPDEYAGAVLEARKEQ